ncbi:hypothetical protein ILYODFUR_011581 [Ilyodon furcidens]|uniref:Uncharacterized protein n=1 Tax=Ilyodon furcidens TaxID=33524 RepID=A0ABV0U5N2_9TELE
MNFCFAVLSLMVVNEHNPGRESWRAARSRLTAPNGGRQLRSAVSCHCELGGLEGREMGSDYRWEDCYSSVSDPDMGFLSREPDAGTYTVIINIKTASSLNGLNPIEDLS